MGPITSQRGAIGGGGGREGESHAISVLPSSVYNKKKYTDKDTSDRQRHRSDRQSDRAINPLQPAE